MPGTPAKIRTATLHDAHAIARVQVETWRSAYRGIVSDQFLDAFSVEERTIRWQELLQPSEQVAFVADIEGPGVVGFARGGMERSGRADFRGELYGLYVLPSWHGTGIGKSLVVTLACWLTDHSIPSMLVWTLSANPFRRFYEHLGGTLIAERTIPIGGDHLGEVAYGWADVSLLTQESEFPI